MNTEMNLQIVAGIQLGIAVLNLFLVKMMKWDEDIARLPLLIREVFQVHTWFISLILTIFGVITLRFSEEILTGKNEVLQWFTGAIAIFWLFRAVFQVFYYSSSHWKGRLDRTLIHIACILVYGGMGIVYLLASKMGGLE